METEEEEEEGGGGDSGAVRSAEDSAMAFVDLSEFRQPADSSPGDPVASVPCVRKLSFLGGSGSAILCHVDLLPVLSSLSGFLMRMDALMTLSESAGKRREFLTSVLRGMGIECRPQVIPRLTQGYLVCSSGVSVRPHLSTIIVLSVLTYYLMCTNNY